MINDPKDHSRITASLIKTFCFTTLPFFLGMNPKSKRIMTENDRLKKAMVQSKEINNRRSKPIHLNKDAAQRFIRSGLWKPRAAKTFEEEEENTWDCP